MRKILFIIYSILIVSCTYHEYDIDINIIPIDTTDMDIPKDSIDIEDNPPIIDYVSIGDTLPSFSIVMNTGEIIGDSDLLGNTSVIVFFNTFCPDCQKLLPHIQHLYDDFDGKGINFILISREETSETISLYWEEQGFTMPYSAQADRGIYNLFAESHLPLVFISDNYNIIHFIHTDSPDIPTYDILLTNINKIYDANITPNILAGDWSVNSHIITFIRKDREFVYSDDNITKTGSFNIEFNDELQAIIIRGRYDYDAGFWEHQYIIEKLKADYMKWVAVDDENIVYEFYRVSHNNI